MPSPRVTALIGLVCFVPGAILPGWFAERSRPLSSNLDFTVSSRPTVAQVKGRAQPISFTQQVITGKSVKTGTVTFHTTQTLETGADSYQFSQDTLLNRESTYPMLEGERRQVAVLNGREVNLGSFDGLTAFFPSRTEQRSYPYFDVIAQETIPIDYLEEESFRGVNAFVFHQERQGLQVADELADSPVSYSLNRTMWVEPTTGVILSQREAIELTGADGSQLLDTTLEWDDAAQTAAVDRVRSSLHWVKVSVVGGWVLSFVGVVLLIRAAVSYAKARR